VRLASLVDRGDPYGTKACGSVNVLQLCARLLPKAAGEFARVPADQQNAFVDLSAISGCGFQIFVWQRVSLERR
jgi:hypothetical protein